MSRSWTEWERQPGGNGKRANGGNADGGASNRGGPSGKGGKPRAGGRKRKPDEKWHQQIYERWNADRPRADLHDIARGFNRPYKEVKCIIDRLRKREARACN
jgi:hypothetical protein